MGWVRAAEDTTETVIVPSGLGTEEWVTAGVIVAVAILVAVALRRLVQAVVSKAGGRPALGRVLGRVVVAIVVTVGLLSAAGELGVRIGPLVGALGIGGIALAFALQDVLSNLVAGVILQMRNQFRIGDQVNTNDYDGTVHDITLRTVVLDTYDGQRVVLPSAQVLQSPLLNHTAFSHRRTTLRVGVAYGTDLARATEVLQAAAAGVDGVMETPPPAAWADTFADSAIEFAVWFWHRSPVADEWRVRHDVLLAIDRALADAGITIPFPQRRLHWTPLASDAASAP